MSDTLGRAWRMGQTDTAIGSAGVRVIDDFAGRRDPYGNDLHVTAVALADELAGAADLVKTKLAGRPVALVRGLAHLVTEDGGTAAGPDPAGGADLFGYGAQEAVLAAVLAVLGLPGALRRGPRPAARGEGRRPAHRVRGAPAGTGRRRPRRAAARRLADRRRAVRRRARTRSVVGVHSRAD